MENNNYINYLERLKRIRSNEFKNDKVYIEGCKTSINISPKDYKICSNHKLEEYFKKYGKKLEKGKLVAFTKNELWLMNRQSKYWEIKNDSDFIYFEVPNNSKPLLISLIALLVAGGIAGGVTAGVLLNNGGGNELPFSLKFNVNNLTVEGKEDGFKYNAGDEISFTLKNNAPADVKSISKMPSKNEVSVAVVDDFNYALNDDTISISFIAPNRNVTVSAGCYTPLCFFAADDTLTEIAWGGRSLVSGTDIDIETSTDGSNWSDWSSGSPKTLNKTQPLYIRNTKDTLSVDSGSKVFGFYPYNNNQGNVIAKGNILSLINYSAVSNYSFINLFSVQQAFRISSASELRLPYTILAPNCYNSMFAGCSQLTSAPELPATTLAKACYYSMFASCSQLTSAPELPATTLAESCYQNMFAGCSQLTSAPKLPATTLAETCYYTMFYNCTSLTTAPELPATELAPVGADPNDFGVYQSMFSGCTSLTTAPELPATTLEEKCYASMFYGCTSLTAVPELPATTLANSCYASMFCGCTSLTAVPELPATTLAKTCYNAMFMSCDSLTTAPELPATILVEQCYYGMFQSCSQLTRAPELPAPELKDECYRYMFYNCAQLIINNTGTGTKFFKCPIFGSLNSPVQGMFDGTGGSYSVDPVANGEYYFE